MIKKVLGIAVLAFLFVSLVVPAPVKAMTQEEAQVIINGLMQQVAELARLLNEIIARQNAGGSTGSASSISIVSQMPTQLTTGSNAVISWTDTSERSTKYNLLLRNATGQQWPIVWAYDTPPSSCGDCSPVQKTYLWSIPNATTGSELPPPGDYHIAVCHDYEAKCAYTSTFKLSNQGVVGASTISITTAVIDTAELKKGQSFTLHWIDSATGSNAGTYNVLVRNNSGQQWPIKWSYRDTRTNKSYSWEVGEVEGGTLSPGQYHFVVCHNYTSQCAKSFNFTLSSDSTIRINSDLPAQVVSGSVAKITWQDSAVDDDKYHVYLRSTTGGQWPIALFVGAKSYNWTVGTYAPGVTAPAAGGTYYITVCHDHEAKCATGNNFTFSAAPSTQTMAITSTVPASLSRGASYQLKWTDSIGQASYNVLLRNTSGQQKPLAWVHTPTVGSDGVRTFNWTVGQGVEGDVSSGSYYFTVCHTVTAKCATSSSFNLVTLSL